MLRPHKKQEIDNHLVFSYTMMQLK